MHAKPLRLGGLRLARLCLLPLALLLACMMGCGRAVHIPHAAVE